MNNLPTATLTLDTAWIGEGPTLRAWFPFDSWCDGFFWKSPAEYEATVRAVAESVWKGIPFDSTAPAEHPRVTCQHVWQWSDMVLMSNPPIYSRTCKLCAVRFEIAQRKMRRLFQSKIASLARGGRVGK